MTTYTKSLLSQIISSLRYTLSFIVLKVWKLPSLMKSQHAHLVLVHYLLQCSFLVESIARVQRFFRLDGCLLFFINLISLKHSFVSFDCCSDLKAVWIRGKTFFLFGLKFVTNAKLSLSVLTSEVLKFSMKILFAFRITSWIKFCGYSWECIKNFWSKTFF